MKKGRRWLLAACAAAVSLSGTCGLAVCAASYGPWAEILPEEWSAAQAGRQPVVKAQGGLGTCWALTALSAVEAALLPEQQMVFSADHMAMQNHFSVPIEEGGTYQMAMAYLTGWQGPVTEAADPYGDGVSPEGLEPAVHVQEIRIWEEPSREEIKRAVYRYGAVQTSLFLSRATTSENQNYYRKETASYYYPEKKTPNHETLIVGWDDDYPRFLFAQLPEQDGAFLCQNTWGEEFGRSGLYYVSYEDANLGGTALAYTRVENTGNYDALYQTDDCGWQGRQGYDADTCWFANAYTSEETEELAAVGFYVVGPDTSCDIFLVPEFVDGSSFANRILLKSQTFPEAGYYTVDLEEGVSLVKGQRFAVAVKIRTPGEGQPVAVEYRADAYTQNIVTEGKYGYLSEDGENWLHTEQTYGTNVCLKVYTNRSLPG